MKSFFSFMMSALVVLVMFVTSGCDSSTLSGVDADPQSSWVIIDNEETIDAAKYGISNDVVENGIIVAGKNGPVDISRKAGEAPFLLWDIIDVSRNVDTFEERVNIYYTLNTEEGYLADGMYALYILNDHIERDFIEPELRTWSEEFGESLKLVEVGMNTPYADGRVEFQSHEFGYISKKVFLQNGGFLLVPKKNLMVTAESGVLSSTEGLGREEYYLQMRLNIPISFDPDHMVFLELTTGKFLDYDGGTTYDMVVYPVNSEGSVFARLEHVSVVDETLVFMLAQEPTAVYVGVTPIRNGVKMVEDGRAFFFCSMIREQSGEESARVKPDFNSSETCSQKG